MNVKVFERFSISSIVWGVINLHINFKQKIHDACGLKLVKIGIKNSLLIDMRSFTRFGKLKLFIKEKI